MPGGFTFGATARGFFIPAVAFFGGMVAAGDGIVEGERRRVGIGETRQRRGGGGVCSGREPAGSGGKWRVWWGKWSDMGKTGGKAVVSPPREPRASDWNCRGVSAFPIGSCRTGAGTGAPAHLLGSPTHRRNFGGAGAGCFWAPSPKSTLGAFWEAFWERR
jgi:hypothetical protein